ncbi:MAG: ATPase [Tannerellaceae bacterium]|jgi:V/A-type H+-transporting ATPase subunit I|nr:ATPase [Tannerellaceae bacterium]
MILPMKKYAFMVYHKEYADFLNKLRDLGVVHINATKPIAGNADLQAIIGERKRIKSLIAQLEGIRSSLADIPAEIAPAKQLSRAEGLQMIDAFEALQEKKATLIADKQALQKDLEYMELWGDFSYADIENLKEAGYNVNFFTCPSSRFDPKWTDKHNAFLVNNQQSVSYFITITPEGETPDIEADRPRMPDRSLGVLRNASRQLDERIDRINQRMEEAAIDDYATLNAFDKSLLDDFNLSNAMLQTERQADNHLMFMQGWIIASQAPQLEAALNQQGYFYRQVAIEDGDKVPIRLKNNRYARLFEPLTEMFSLPNYGEIDPTPLLAPFFMLFFGLCFGDAGYGLLVLLAGTLLKAKVAPAMKPVLSLAQWLGGTAMVVGTLAGTFFGIALVDVPALASVKQYFLTTDNLMTLSIVLGLVHIVFGKIVAATKTCIQRGLKYGIAPWGWVVAIVSLLLAMGLPTLGITLSPAIINVCYGAAAVAGLAILFYNSPGKNIFINIGSALWALYNAASGMLGDALSYIRLFAIGLTGGILGGVFNMLGVEMTAGLPIYARIPVMLLILLIGHGLNIAICTIGSLVHPLRLIYVEYFKNSEYEGGGIAYLPFKKAQ